jgi:hypothetical protein
MSDLPVQRARWLCAERNAEEVTAKVGEQGISVGNVGRLPGSQRIWSHESVAEVEHDRCDLPAYQGNVGLDSVARNVD